MQQDQWSTDAADIQAAVREWMSRPDFMRADPRAFFDTCGQGIDPVRDFVVYAALRDAVGGVYQRYLAAYQDAARQMRRGA